MDTFGNTRLLLQTITVLWKNKMVCGMLQGIKNWYGYCNINEHFWSKYIGEKLVDELYYGGHFKKVLTLLGNNHKRKFISNCKDPDERRPVEWAWLVAFLKKKLKVHKCFYHSWEKQKVPGYWAKKLFGGESKKRSIELLKIC